MLLTSIATEAYANVFRSGTLSWRLVSGRTVEFTVRETNAYASNFPPPVVGSLLSVVDVLNLGEGNAIFHIDLTVKSVNTTEGTFYGEATYTFEYDEDGTFTAAIENCCRGPELASNVYGEYRVETTVTVGDGNNSPVSTLPEIVDLPIDQANASFTIPATDPDNDPISFRLPTFEETLLDSQEDLSVNAAGVAQFNTTGKTVGQLWPVAVVVEDDRGAKIILNFLIRIVGTVMSAPTVSSLSASPSPACVGESVTFTATVGNTAGIYSYTLDNGAGSVQSGTASGSAFSQSLNATGSGSQTYTLTITNTNTNGSASTTAPLTVNAVPAAPTLSASPGTTTTNQPITVTASGCAGGTVNWTSGGGTGVVDGNTNTFSQPGKYTLSATCTQNDCTSSASVTLSLRISPAPGSNACGPNGQNVRVCFYGNSVCVPPIIAERLLKSGARPGGCNAGNARIAAEEISERPLKMSLKAYPNPVRDIVTVEVIAVVAGPAQLEVVDLNGKLLQLRTEELTEGINTLNFNLSRQAAGGYFLRCIDSRGQQAAVRVQKE